MKKIIITISLILISLIIVKHNVDIKENKYKINGLNFALSVDGEKVDSLPSTGSYYLSNYYCEKGSILKWDRENNKLHMEGIKSNTDSCYLEFDKQPYLNTMQVGDYVAYVGNNGCKNGETEVTGTSDAESGNSCLGENANQPAGTTDSNGLYGYCGVASYKFYTTGWRIAYIEDGNVYLTSAGSPECRTRTSSNENTTQINDLNTAALKYCNSTYVDGKVCYNEIVDNPNTWAMGNEDFQKITKAITGVRSSLSSIYNSNNYCNLKYSEKRCGYNHDMIDNGGYYYFSAYYTNKSTDSYYTSGVLWSADYRSVARTTTTSAYGFRPIIRLSSSVYVTGGDGTMEEPYTIGI